jgi:alpha-ribazole phosphatase
MHITLIRHTTVDVPPSMIYGHTDVPLSASFEDEAEKIVGQTGNYTFDAVYSSPISRCIRLAHKISPCVIPDARLMELNFGDWERKFWKDIDQSPKAKAWFANYVNIPAPSGESFDQMISRCRAFLEDIKTSNYNNICIVTHGGPIRAIKSIIDNTPPQEAFSIKVRYGEIIQLTLNKLK